MMWQEMAIKCKAERDALKAENARILEIVAEAQGMLVSPADVSSKLAEAFVGKVES